MVSAAVCAIICGCPSRERASFHTACSSSQAAGSFARALASALATSALAAVNCTVRIAAGSLPPPIPSMRFQTIGSRSSSSRIAETSGSVGGSAMGSSPRRTSRATKSATVSFFGNALTSAVSFADAWLACSGGKRWATSPSDPIAPRPRLRARDGHGLGNPEPRDHPGDERDDYYAEQHFSHHSPSEPPSVADLRARRRTVLTLPLLPPPQKN